MKIHLIVLFNFFVLIDSSVITTSFGSIEGNKIGNFLSFKKIPFAKPPIGELRFQKPEIPEKWKGTLNAKEYGAACMSNSSSTTSPQKWVDEDCLHLNIFTSEKCLNSKDCAVVVYIHGGELIYDSAVMFNDTILFETFVDRDVILVIPAFRLGIFSHFVVQDQNIAPSNLALYDILLSLDFVKSEIHSFGGDNNRVTVFGHSYGGHIVSILGFSTKINTDLSLFQRAVSMSAVNVFETLDSQIEKTRRFAKHSNCSIPLKSATKMTENEKDLYMLKCLQKKDQMDILRMQRSLEDAGYPLYDGLIIREPLFQEVPIQQFYDNPKSIPILTGCTKLELDKFQAYHNIVETLGFDNYKECDAKYRKDKEEKNYDFEGHADETLAILAQTKLRVDKLLEKNIPTYLYEYTYPKHGAHTDDLSYLMGVHAFEKDENEAHLAKVYQNIFMNFVKFGVPGDGFEETNSENSTFFDVYWNETTGEKPTMKNGFEPKITKYWLKDMFEYDRNITAAKKAKIFKVPTVRFYSETSEYNQISYMYISLLLLSMIFLIGCFVGRCCYTGRRDRHLYIQLDGNDQDWQTVKHV